MPELPEVEIISRSLQKKIESDSIEKAKVTFAKLLKNIDCDSFVSNLTPMDLTRIYRKGKYLVFEDLLHNKWMTVHLGMTGAFFVLKGNENVPERYRKHQHLSFELKSQRTLVYCDIRKFGDIRFFTEDPANSYRPFLELGPDPLTTIDDSRFKEKIKSNLFSSKEIKPSLLDSRLIAGVGNIYACEILFLNGIHPETVNKDLTDEQLSKLYSSIREMFEFSIEKGGSSVSDYVNSEGTKGEFQNFHKIYQKPVCSSCGNTVSKIIQNKRSTFYCAHCQSL